MFHCLARVEADACDEQIRSLDVRELPENRVSIDRVTATTLPQRTLSRLRGHPARDYGRWATRKEGSPTG